MTEDVYSFTDEYEFLSNFHYPYCWVVLDGKKYISVEHAYQAAKTLDLALREQFRRIISPDKAKRLGKKLKLRRGWDHMRIDVMRQLLRQKFTPGSDLATRLLATQHVQLIEGNSWKDRFWGKIKRKGEWVGQNQLGKLLMEIRDELR